MESQEKYLSIVPEAIKKTSSENESWIRFILRIPGGYERILSCLKTINIYDFNQNYSKFIQALPVNDETFNLVYNKVLSKEDIIKLYLYYSMYNVEYALKLINKYPDIHFDIEESEYITSKLKPNNILSIRGILDKLLESSNNYIHLYYLCYKDKELGNRVIKYMDDHIELVLSRSDPARWVTILTSIKNNKDRGAKYILNHIDCVFKEYKEDRLLLVHELFHEYPSLQQASEEYNTEHFKEIITGLYMNKAKVDVPTEDDYLNIDYLYELINKIAENEGVTLGSITRCGTGFYSNCLSIGNKVFKLSDGRAVENPVDSPYILKPLVRTKLKTSGEYKLFVEVTEKAKTLKEGEISEDAMYDLYRALRDLHIVWVDIREDNLGILLKDNIVHWNTPLAYSSEDLGMTPMDSDLVLKTGDLVIIDNDHMYYEGEVPEECEKPEFNAISYYQKFEKRYQSEIKKLRK